jgi:hypothetical protein
MSLGRAITEAERLDLYDLETLATVIGRLQERAVASMSREDRARHQARERQRRARAERDQATSRSVTERDETPHQSVTERDQSVTGSVTERDRGVTKRDAASALARAPSEDCSLQFPSASADRSPQIDLSASDARARESRSDVTLTPSVTGHATERDRDTTAALHESIDTGQAERCRKLIVAAYKAHAPAVPRRVLSLTGRPEDTAAMAGMSEAALPGILARFFADRDMKAKGWPIGHLLANPSQWSDVATGWKRDEGAPRQRPTEDEVPPWVLAEREREAKEAEHG